ncbi:cysteine desulfurase family protein [Planctomyces sp. SH-PL62]|uniref:cysteine desulfurase family protein n=1 Tax=Planctomyces sp. SH-PL62 TaxID=1636152 RepID=UPI00078C6938|nr:cysteine desulfurase family protein [Planctomyces sp. SH-PL62]AMV37014.1 Cysteine desulfurase [Planctomyces sp. SH-PL62]
MSRSAVYLDNHSTTKPDPRVVEAMLPYLTEVYGNAASVSHRFGRDAAEAVERARVQVAGALGAAPREIVFTSGATEANNLAIKGVLPGLRRRGDHLVATTVEHKSVLDVVERLAREDDWKLTLVPCDESGRVDAEAVRQALRPETVLVSVMTANNEVGTINPIREIGAICHERGVVFHTDATQAVGKLDLNVEADQIDLLSLSAHKLYGPKGIGALYVRRRDPQVRLRPLFDGGGHERGMRSGTLAVPLIVGLGAAVELAIRERSVDLPRIRGLRDRLEAGIRDRVSDVTLNGHPVARLDGNLNLSFAYVDGEALMMAMRDIAVSSGAACTSAEPESSHVLRAMGRDEDSARASLRFGVGRFNTADEIDFAIELVANAVSTLRLHSAAWTAGAGRNSSEHVSG